METARGSSMKPRVAFFSLALLLWACSPRDRAAPLPKETFPVGSHCYLIEFEPAQFPWKEAECLNYEEVFKNYAYFEARSDSSAQPITVKVGRFVRGKKVEESGFIAVSDRGKWTLQATKE